MTPLIDGFYLSDRMHSEEWHAGVRMTDDYFRFLKFFHDGFWLRCDHRSALFDFPDFVRKFDLTEWRQNHMNLSPPSSEERDGGELFQFGTFQSGWWSIHLSFHSPRAQTTFTHKVSVSEKGRELRGWKHRFIFHPEQDLKTSGL